MTSGGNSMITASSIHQTVANNSPPPQSGDAENMSPAHHHNISPYTMHSQTSPSMVAASVGGQGHSPNHIEHHHNMSPNSQHHNLSPLNVQYTHQLSPVTSSATNLINPTGKFIQHSYMVHNPHMDVQAMMTPPSYSPMQSPKSIAYYGITPGNIIGEHEVKIEANHHHHHHHGVVQSHGIHAHLQHLQPHIQTHGSASRSPSVEDERVNNESNLHELQSQILARNAERPTVVNGVNIKME